MVTRADQTRVNILRLIQQGNSGDRLPGESELASRFGVSRVTVREALRQLWHEGLVVRRWGAGTYIAEPPADPDTAYRSIYVDVGVVGSLPNRIRATGLDVKIDGFEAVAVSPPDWVAHAMGTTDELWRIERTLRIDDRPGLRFADYLPLRIGDVAVDPGILVHPDRSLPDLLALHGVRAIKDEARLDAVAAPAAVAASLDVPAGHPVLRARQRTQDENGTVVECAEVYYNGDIFATVLVRSSGDTQ
jgi:GntR family transcriptional regulator